MEIARPADPAGPGCQLHGTRNHETLPAAGLLRRGRTPFWKKPSYRVSRQRAARPWSPRWRCTTRSSRAASVSTSFPCERVASEKFEEFSGKGLRVGIATGDFDRKDEYLGRNDIIVATSEKVDSLLRNQTPWLADITLLVLDEVHLIG